MTDTTHKEPNYIAVFWWLAGFDPFRARGYLYADSQASDLDPSRGLGNHQSRTGGTLLHAPQV